VGSNQRTKVLPRPPKGQTHFFIGRRKENFGDIPKKILKNKKTLLSAVYTNGEQQCLLF
jgi:hypothetical protein